MYDEIHKWNNNFNEFHLALEVFLTSLGLSMSFDLILARWLNPKPKYMLNLNLTSQD